MPEVHTGTCRHVNINITTVLSTTSSRYLQQYTTACKPIRTRYLVLNKRYYMISNHIIWILLLFSAQDIPYPGTQVQVSIIPVRIHAAVYTVKAQKKQYRYVHSGILPGPGTAALPGTGTTATALYTWYQNWYHTYNIIPYTRVLPVLLWYQIWNRL